MWGSGSIGVRWCGSRVDAERHAADLLAQRVNERGLPVPQEVLIEAYVEGDEYSVEICHGTVVGITCKHLSAAPPFIGTGLRSLVAQRDHGIDSRRLPRSYVTGQERGAEKNRHGQRQCPRIICLHTEEKRFDKP